MQQIAKMFKGFVFFCEALWTGAEASHGTRLVRKWEEVHPTWSLIYANTSQPNSHKAIRYDVGTHLTYFMTYKNVLDLVTVIFQNNTSSFLIWLVHCLPSLHSCRLKPQHILWVEIEILKIGLKGVENPPCAYFLNSSKAREKASYSICSQGISLETFNDPLLVSHKLVIWLWETKSIYFYFSLGKNKNIFFGNGAQINLICLTPPTQMTEFK